MIRVNHFYYDLRELLGSPKFIIGVLVVGAFFTLYISFQFVYLFILIFGFIIGVRGLIGRRCPRCDGPLVETGAEPDSDNAFVIHIHWTCPRDGYTEDEQTKGDAGLFGVN